MSKAYRPVVDRRTTLKWMVAGLGTASLIPGCKAGTKGDGAQTQSLLLDQPSPITGRPYGGDPDMIEMAVTWQPTMTQKQLDLVSALSDIVLPETDELPSASKVGIPDFINEWVSSPYPQTADDREKLFSLFEWMESEARATGAVSFAAANQKVITTLLDRIAWKDRIETGLEEQADGFDLFRRLSVSAYFASEEGSYWLGYRGNEPAMGDYAGPTQDAIEHLQGVLADLNLKYPVGL